MGGKNVLTLPRAITFLNIWKIIAIISIIKRCHFSINLENDKVLKAVVYWLVRTTFSGLTVMRVKTSGAPLIRHLNWNSNKLEILTTSQSSPSRQVSMFSKKWLVWENVVKFSVYLRDSMEERWSSVRDEITGSSCHFSDRCSTDSLTQTTNWVKSSEDTGGGVEGWPALTDWIIMRPSMERGEVINNMTSTGDCDLMKDPQL